MQSAFEKAIQLILSADAELCNILFITAKMSLTSSIIALLLLFSSHSVRILT